MRENPKYLSDPLWHRIEAYGLDDPGAIFPFSQKLAHQQQWSTQFVLRAIGEYKRFIYLCCTSNTGASPPPIVDEVWHLHLTYTVDYWQRFCGDTLQREVHHHPSRGGPGERHKHDHWYAETVKLYRQTFGEDPPADIWPPPVSPPLTPVPHHAPLHKHYRYGTLLLVLPFIYIACTWHRYDPYQLKGPWFLRFYLLLIVACLAQWFVSLVKKQKLLRQVLRPVLPLEHPAALTYLANGTRGTLLYYIGSLIQTGALEHAGGDVYRIRQQSLMHSLPEHAALMQETGDTILYGRLVVLLQPLADAPAKKYLELEVAYTDVLGTYIIPALVLLMGIARMAQGVFHHRPVGLLLVEMMIMGIAYGIIAYQYSFSKVCMRLLRDDEELSSHITADFDRRIIFSGVAAVAAFPWLLHLEQRFNHSGGSSGDGGSSCGSSCGGSCGGGCGGCGGCGG
jgi:hypothetical protein